jgi:hypothetical protein
MPGSPWIVVVVRAWVQNDDRLIRMTLSSPGLGRRVVTYEPSSAAAGRRLQLWMDELAVSSPASDAAEDATVTAEGRRDDGDLPTVSEPPATSRHHEET